MANYNILKSILDRIIKTNRQRSITGDVLNEQLKGMVNALGAGYQYMGKAQPTTAPGTPDYNVFYVAESPGTYAHFGNLVVNEGELALLKFDGVWEKDAVSVSPNIDEVVVTVDDQTGGEPSGTGYVSGNTLHLSFSNLKGEQGEQGQQGNTGSSVDYPYELVNNLTTNDPTKGLSAAQGKVLRDLINTVAYNVQTLIDNLANIAYIGPVPTYEDMGVITPTWSVTTDLTNYTMAENITEVAKNRSYANTLVPAPGYQLDTATIIMGETDITSQCYNPVTGAIYIPMVTGNLTIAGAARRAPVLNLAFNGISITGVTGQYAWLGLYDGNYSLSPLIRCSQGDSITFGHNNADTSIGNLVFFNEDFQYLAYYAGNANPRTVTIPYTNYKYCAMLIPTAKFSTAYLINNTTGDSFDGSTFPSSNIMTADDFREYSPLSVNVPWENERGDMMNWNGQTSVTAKFTNERSSYKATKYTSIGVNREDHLANAFISKKVSLADCGKDGEGKYSITFYCGSSIPASNGPLLMLNDDPEEYRNYYSATAAARTVSVGSHYTSVQIMSYADAYEDCYIKDEINNVIIWSGSSNE